MRNFDFKPRKVCVVGMTGQGKSTHTRHLMATWGAGYTFAYDHKDELRIVMGAHQCRTNEEMKQALISTRSVCWRPSGPVRSGLKTWLETVILICKRLPGRKLVTFDEPGLILPRFASAPEADANGIVKDFWHPAQEIMDDGRGLGIDVLISGQRCTHLHTDFRGQINEWHIFKSSAGWVKPLEQEYGIDLAACVDLPVGHFIKYHTETGELTKGEAQRA